MAYETKPNSGSLFKNDRKEKETHPDYKGQAIVGGAEMWVSAWIKEGKSGKFMSLSFTPKEDEKPTARQSKDIDSDIPF